MNDEAMKPFQLATSRALSRDFEMFDSERNKFWRYLLIIVDSKVYISSAMPAVAFLFSFVSPFSKRTEEFRLSANRNPGTELL